MNCKRPFTHFVPWLLLLFFTTSANADSIAFGDFEESSIYVIYPGASREDQRLLWNQYPSGDIYSNPSVVEPGTASINTTEAVHGSHSLKLDVDSGAAYMQFYPYTYPEGWYFLREVVENKLGLGTWRYDHFNRIEFYVKAPSNLDPATGGMQNMWFGTYLRTLTEDRSNHESNNLHFYHAYNITPNGGWTKCIVDMHPTHQRDESGGTDQGNQPYPTKESGHNYFDTLTRFYVDFDSDYMDGKPSAWLFDGFRLYRETILENEDQVYGVCGTYSPGDNKLIVSWNRHKSENDIKHEVRYAFQSIHSIGWDAASTAPGSPVSPQGWQGYNGIRYENGSINMVSHSSIFIAIKPSNSSLFKQIEIPLTSIIASPSSPPLPPTNLEVK